MVMLSLENATEVLYIYRHVLSVAETEATAIDEEPALKLVRGTSVAEVTDPAAGECFTRYYSSRLMIFLFPAA